MRDDQLSEGLCSVGPCISHANPIIPAFDFDVNRSSTPARTPRRVLLSTTSSRVHAAVAKRSARASATR